MAEASCVLLKLHCVLQGPTLKMLIEHFFSLGWTASSFYSMDLVESRTSCSGFTALETVPNHFVFQEFSAFRKTMLITYFLSGCKILETMLVLFFVVFLKCKLSPSVLALDGDRGPGGALFPGETGRLR